jgi:hypothetical protein
MSRRLLPALLLSALLAHATIVSAPLCAQELSYPSPQVPQNMTELSYARIVRLSLVEGQAQVYKPEDGEWVEALLNLPIRQGYRLATAAGRVEVEFESGATARLAENSALEFRELALTNGRRLTHLVLSRGTGTFYANLDDNDTFAVSTPHLSVQFEKSARFRVDVTDAGSNVGVLKGEVTVAALGATYTVKKNRALYLSAADEQILLARLPDEDDWDRWVAERDETLLASRERASRYVGSSPYRYGLSDLDRYGNWYNVPGYGWGWQPWGVGVGWIPYSYGTWHFVGGIGWSWLSFEPWGWMPYHFGSWIYSSRFGWVWLPGYFDCWRPARVFYVWNNNRLHWGPLAPHDRPGQTPANLPHGTVTVVSGPPAGWGGATRITRADLGIQPGMKVFYEPPQNLTEEALGARPIPRVLISEREGLGKPARTPAPAPAVGAAAPPLAVPRSGYSGTAPQPPRAAEERADFPRGTRRSPQVDVPSGIVYDPQSGRYINDDVRPRSGYSGSVPRPAEIPRAGENDARKPQPVIPQRGPSYDRRATDDTPIMSAPPTRGWGGTATQPPAPKSEMPRYEPRHEPRPQTPRYEIERPQPRHETPPPRYEAPRPSPPPPRVEAPRPSGGGWGGATSRPPSPPPPPPRPKNEQ